MPYDKIEFKPIPRTPFILGVVLTVLFVIVAVVAMILLFTRPLHKPPVFDDPIILPVVELKQEG